MVRSTHLVERPLDAEKLTGPWRVAYRQSEPSHEPPQWCVASETDIDEWHDFERWHQAMTSIGLSMAFWATALHQVAESAAAASEAEATKVMQES